MEDILKHAKNTQVKGHCIYKEATLFPISTKCLVVVFFFFSNNLWKNEMKFSCKWLNRNRPSVLLYGNWGRIRSCSYQISGMYE